MPFVESPRLSGDIVMANKWFRECKAGSWEPWTLKGMMFDASMGFLIGLPAHGCAYVFIRISTVMFVELPFYVIPSNVNDLSMCSMCSSRLLESKMMQYTLPAWWRLMPRPLFAALPTSRQHLPQTKGPLVDCHATLSWRSLN